MTSGATADERRHAAAVLDALKQRYPEIGTALRYDDPWQLLVATVLSAQTTDENVNAVTPVLFERWPVAEDLAAANPEEVEEVVYSTGFFRQKTKSIIALSADLVERFDGVVPADLDDLITLHGVGRKTASVVLAEAFGVPAIAVDTHVNRVTNRLGMVDTNDPVQIEFELRDVYPEEEWGGISMRVIQFGREVCEAHDPESPLVVVTSVRSMGCVPTRTRRHRPTTRLRTAEDLQYAVRPGGSERYPCPWFLVAAA